jgi:periplasmic protein CpxP/Spy
MIGTKAVLLALAVGGASLLGLGAYRVSADGGFPGHRRGNHKMMLKFVEYAMNEKLDAVGATEAQKQKVRAIKDRLVKEGETLHGDRDEFRKELLALLEQENPDPARVKALAHQRIELFSRFADNAADAVVELHGVFTPDQRQKLIAELREHMDRHRH